MAKTGLHLLSQGRQAYSRARSVKKAGSSLPSQEQSRAAHFQSPVQQQTHRAERPPARDEVALCPFSLFNQHIMSCDHKIRWHRAATADWRACISTDVTVFSIRTDHLVKPAMFTDPPIPAVFKSQQNCTSYNFYGSKWCIAEQLRK